MEKVLEPLAQESYVNVLFLLFAGKTNPLITIELQQLKQIETMETSKFKSKVVPAIQV